MVQRKKKQIESIWNGMQSKSCKANAEQLSGTCDKFPHWTRLDRNIVKGVCLLVSQPFTNSVRRELLLTTAKIQPQIRTLKIYCVRTDTGMANPKSYFGINHNFGHACTLRHYRDLFCSGRGFHQPKLP